MKELNLMNDYYELCDELYFGWLAKDEKINSDSLISDLFDFSLPPEPYLILKNGDTPLYILNSFPEKGPRQDRVQTFWQI